MTEVDRGCPGAKGIDLIPPLTLSISVSSENGEHSPVDQTPTSNSHLSFMDDPKSYSRKNTWKEPVTGSREPWFGNLNPVELFSSCVIRLMSTPL